MGINIGNCVGNGWDKFNFNKNNTNSPFYQKNNISNIKKWKNYQDNNSKDLTKKSSEQKQLIDALKDNRIRENKPKSIVEESLNYAKSLEATRTSKKNTGLETKKVRYNFKAISSQILRAKTSMNAKQVVSKAKRMVAKLKKQKESGEYDKDEIEIAINHAKSMERVAKKKANHLVEEEIAKAKNGFGYIEDEEKEEKENLEDDTVNETDDEIANKVADSENEDILADNDEEFVDEKDFLVSNVMNNDNYRDLFDKIFSNIDDMELDELLSETNKALEELEDDTFLEDLKDLLMSEAYEKMDQSDYKMMKIKHRTKEMKEIVKADSEYLKETFKHFEETRSNSVDSQNSFGGSGQNESGMLENGTTSGGLSSTLGGIDITI